MLLLLYVLFHLCLLVSSKLNVPRWGRAGAGRSGATRQLALRAAAERNAEKDSLVCTAEGAAGATVGDGAESGSPSITGPSSYFPPCRFPFPTLPVIHPPVLCRAQYSELQLNRSASLGPGRGSRWWSPSWDHGIWLFRPLFELYWLTIAKGSRRIDSKVAYETIVVRISTGCGQPELGRRQLAASYSLVWG